MPGGRDIWGQLTVRRTALFLTLWTIHHPHSPVRREPEVCWANSRNIDVYPVSVLLCSLMVFGGLNFPNQGLAFKSTPHRLLLEKPNLNIGLSLNKEEKDVTKFPVPIKSRLPSSKGHGVMSSSPSC